MTAAEVLTGGGIVLVAMTLIQISPIKLDPWSAIAVSYTHLTLPTT